MKYRWQVAESLPAQVTELSRTRKISRLFAQCLLNRGIRELSAIEKFLSPRLKNLSDPFLLPGMKVAVERLFQARQDQEPMVIFW